LPDRPFHPSKFLISEEEDDGKGGGGPFFLQISNLHPGKQKYKSEKETFYFYYAK